jgi:hypothetical protein
MKFIARHDRPLFSLVFAILMIVHVFNTEKVFLNFHIANSVAAITLVLIAWARVIEGKVSRQKRLLAIASFVTTFEAVGFVITQDLSHVPIVSVPFWIILTSIAPLIFNIIVIGIVGWHPHESTANY